MVVGTIGVEVVVLKTLEIEWRKKRPGPDCEAEVMTSPHNEAGCRGVGCPD